ncbi:MAG: alpha/beta fold hydrolase [Symploca sp. SIO2G7]|nr:alpha/beta fold hydrolase [Symploca sp. SIO2G7]
MTALPALPAGLEPALYPFQRKLHALAFGHHLHYVDEGPSDGQPVVMLHGNPTWSFYYRKVVQKLNNHFRCLVPDHIGMGLSDRPSDSDYNYTLKSRVEDLTKWLDAVAPDRPIDLIVHDWGGAIGMSWAVQNPERVRRIVLLNTWAFNIPKDERLPRSLSFARTGLGGFLINRFNAFSGLATRMATVGKLDKEIAHGLVAPYLGKPEQRLATLRFVQDIPLKQTDPAWAVLAETEKNLHRLADKPIYIGWGANDFVFNDRVLEEWRKHYPNAKIDYMKNVGHYTLEDAEPDFFDRIHQHVFA